MTTIKLKEGVRLHIRCRRCGGCGGEDLSEELHRVHEFVALNGKVSPELLWRAFHHENGLSRTAANNRLEFLRKEGFLTRRKFKRERFYSIPERALK